MHETMPARNTSVRLPRALTHMLEAAEDAALDARYAMKTHNRLLREGYKECATRSLESSVFLRNFKAFCNANNFAQQDVVVAVQTFLMEDYPDFPLPTGNRTPKYEYRRIIEALYRSPLHDDVLATVLIASQSYDASQQLVKAVYSMRHRANCMSSQLLNGEICANFEVFAKPFREVCAEIAEEEMHEPSKIHEFHAVSNHQLNDVFIPALREYCDTPYSPEYEVPQRGR